MMELDIINATLAATGSSSVSSVEGRHPSLLRVRPIVQRWSRTLQSRGHWFNTDWGLEIQRDRDTLEVTLPQRTLKADISDDGIRYVRRGKRLYDPHKNTFQIAHEAVKVDVVVELDFDDLPIVMADLIKAHSVLEAVKNYDSDALAIRGASMEVQRATTAFGVERMTQAHITLKDNPAYARIMGGVRYSGHHMVARKLGGTYG